MKTIEDRLWDFIDGTCTADEKVAMEQLIAADGIVKNLYEQLLVVHEGLKKRELDEPSMRFTQNVMDHISLEPAPKLLQTRVDKKIIRLIGAFFILSLTSLFVFALTQINLRSGSDFSFSLPQPDWSKYLSGPYTLAIAISAIILTLIGIDRYLQYRRSIRIINAA